MSLVEYSSNKDFRSHVKCEHVRSTSYFYGYEISIIVHFLFIRFASCPSGYLKDMVPRILVALYPSGRV